MITITSIGPDHPTYAAVSAFAQKQYQERLSACIAGRPDFFAYAERDGEILGCIGITHPPCTIEDYVPRIFPRIAGGEDVPSQMCAEIGTRAVVHGDTFRSIDVSIALTAAALNKAYKQGIRYVAFTATREMRLIVRPLGIDAISFGPPDTSGLDTLFLKNWERFFALGQTCYGFAIPDTERYRQVLEKLKRKDIHSR